MPTFHHLAIQVFDLDRAVEFYSGLLELPILVRHRDAKGEPRSVWVGLDGGGFLALERCLERRPSPPFRDQASGLHLLALGIEPGERGRWEEKLAAAGHEKVAETAFTFYVRDPEGNRVGLSHHPHPADGG